LLAELNSELWVGDPAQIRAKRVRKQKNDRRDAEHLLKLMLGWVGRLVSLLAAELRRS